MNCFEWGVLSAGRELMKKTNGFIELWTKTFIDDEPVEHTPSIRVKVKVLL